MKKYDWKNEYNPIRRTCLLYTSSSIPQITTFIRFHKHFQNIGFNQDFATNL